MLRRVDIGAARNVFFQHVVLHCAGQLAYLRALFLRYGDIQGQQDARGGIDGHRGADAFQRQTVEQRFHIFQAGDRDADFAHFSFRKRVIRVVTHLRWEIESDGEAGGTM